MKRYAALLIIVILALSLTPLLCVSAAPEKIRVGWFEQKGSSEIRDGVCSGYNYEYLTELAMYTGWKYEFVEADLTTCFRMLENGEIDLLGSLFKTDERAALYDFSAYDYGYSYATLFTRIDSKLSPYDFNAFDGMSVAMLKSSETKRFLDEYADDNGFTCNAREYADTDALTEAVLSGECDAGIIGAFADDGKIKPLAVLAPMPYYFATTKGSELLPTLNAAIEKIKNEAPNLELELYEKYFGGATAINLTEDELELVERSKSEPAVFGIISSSPPICYLDDDGEYDGVFINILREIENRTGLNIEYATLDLATNNAIGWLRSGEYDAITGVLKTRNFIEDDTLLLSDSLTEDAIVIVGREHDDFTEAPESKTIAVPSGFQVGYEYAKEVFPRHNIINLLGETECLDAVADGRADAMLYMRSTLNYVLQNPHYEKLAMLQAFRRDISPCIVTRSDDGELLMSIINKGLKTITADERGSMIIDYTLLNPYKLSYGDIIYKYRMSIGVVAVLVVFVISALVSLIVIRRRSEIKLKAAYEQEKEALAAAERVSAAKGSFMSRMSHEIRTPLNALIGYNSLAINELEAAKIVETLDNGSLIMKYLSRSDVASHHLLTIINDVLGMSAIESGKIAVVSEKFNLEELLESLSAIFASQAESKNVRFEIIREKNVSRFYMGDRLRINQILTNLLSNAVKFTQRGSVSLVVSAEDGEDKESRVIFKVMDTGIGMEREYMERIWVPFEQANPNIAHQFGGTGLGLSITKSLCDLMNGNIEVESEPEVGTTFTVKLALEPAEGESEQKRNKKPHYDFGGAHIMLVEDNAMNMDLAERILSSANLRIDKAWNGREAYDMFMSSEADPYAVILMDIQMPIMDGYEATQLIRASDHPQAATIPIIAMTADAFAENVAEAFKYGMNGHVAKPIDVRTLFETLSKFV